MSSPAQQSERVELLAEPGVKLTHITSAYPVNGRTVRELRESIARGAPRAPNGARFGAFTTWELNWSYSRSEITPTGCVPIGGTVYLRISVRYPAWKDSAAAPRAVRSAWNQYLGALKAHENNHAAISIRGANRLASELSSLEAPVCTALQDEAQRLATRAAQGIRDENDRYDERTGHGSTEGVVLRR